MNKAYIPADCHTHSMLSPDGHDTPEAVAQRAFELGIQHFTLTDHIENERSDEWGDCKNADRSFEVYKKLKAEYEGRMNVYYGVELGQAMFDQAKAERIIAEHDYDFILGSTHRTRTYERIDLLPDDVEIRHHCMKEYFEEELAIAEWGKISSLAHLTFMLRYAFKGTVGSMVDVSQFDPVIDKILDVIIRNDIALEINSAGIRKGLDVPMPSEEYVQRYYDKGGRLITVGSDAHWATDVGVDIPECLEMLKKIGYNEICVFSRRQPTFIKI